MNILFFETQDEFRMWLIKNHKTEKELMVGFYKVGSGIPSMTWSQSVDQALCFGWIDGIRKSIDSVSYCIRFTPRRPSSIWSTINIKKVEELTKAGLMTPDGLKAFEFISKNKSNIYSYEKVPPKLDTLSETLFKTNLKAWGFFIKQAPSYQKTMTHWVMSAKQEKTRTTRLEKLILFSEQERRMI